MKQKAFATIGAAVDVLLIYDANRESNATVFLSSTGICILVGWLSVFFSEGLESFIGPMARGGYVDSATPGSLFVFFGWFLLLIPVAAWLVYKLSQ